MVDRRRGRTSRDRPRRAGGGCVVRGRRGSTATTSGTHGRRLPGRLRTPRHGPAHRAPAGRPRRRRSRCDRPTARDVIDQGYRHGSSRSSPAGSTTSPNGWPRSSRWASTTSSPERSPSTRPTALREHRTARGGAAIDRPELRRVPSTKSDVRHGPPSPSPVESLHAAHRVPHLHEAGLARFDVAPHELAAACDRLVEAATDSSRPVSVETVGVGQQAQPCGGDRRRPSERRCVHVVVDRHTHPGECSEVEDPRPGAASSKSIRATASPSRNTTFSRHTSLWQTTGSRPVTDR